MSEKQKSRPLQETAFGAGNQNRTDDLVITNDVLYRLSHTSNIAPLLPDDFAIIAQQMAIVNRFFAIC